ncbi:MAG: MaoC/PaaZ C-terminal domain-containing protein [Solirubrobacteraceae bacterium]
MNTTEPVEQYRADLLGVAGEPARFEVIQERIIAYAQATNDVIPQHASGEYAPPVFAIVPAIDVLIAAITGLVPARHLPRVVHGEHDFQFHAPIRPGMTLQTTATPMGIHQKSSGVLAYGLAQTRDASTGELLVEQHMSAFFRNADGSPSAGELPPSHAFEAALRESEPRAKVVQRFDEDQTYRYSSASGDMMPQHLDDAVAKAAGLPGIIIHGLCTMAFCSQAVIATACPQDPTHLARLAVRFSNIAFPGQIITTSLYDASNGQLMFETVADSGARIITDGLAEIRS